MNVRHFHGVYRGSALCGAALLSLAVFFPGGQPPAEGPLAPDGLSLAGIPVAGKARTEVERLAQELAARLLGCPLALRAERRTEPLTGARLGGTADVRGAVDLVFQPPAPQGILAQLHARFSGPPPRDVPLLLTVPEQGVAGALQRFSARLGTEPRDARVSRRGGKLTVRLPRPGKELDFAAIARGAAAALDAPELRSRAADSVLQEPDRAAWLKKQVAIELPASFREALPRITEAQVTEITAPLASFSTGLGSSIRNRIHNVSLACRAIDGLVLLPGDTFSYNRTVGPRVPSAGYREAPVIVRGELQPGSGGGVCQVSSTLYNAALLSDLEIVRRSHHAFPVHYVPAGRDATVVDGAIDFRFRNRLPHPIAIEAVVVRRQVRIVIHGHPADRRQVDLVRSGLGRVGAGLSVVTDPALPAGRRVTSRRARDGRRVTVTRITRKAGEVLRKEVISRDYYRPFPGIVRVGARPARPGRRPEGTRGGTRPAAPSPDEMRPAPDAPPLPDGQ